MKLDRYSTGVPRFRVFRLVEGETNPMNVVRRSEPGRQVIRGEDRRVWAEVDPWDCFVLKRRDAFSEDGLRGYACSAFAAGQSETAEQVERLRSDWLDLTQRRGDAKIPD
jgi:hypothetical protein